jgi:predicted amidohydrolase YtcJ
MGARGSDGRILIDRRGLLKSGTAAGAAALGAGALGGFPRMAVGADDGHPDLILRNGRIHTMDDRNSVVSSVAIKNGKIISAGHGGPRGGPDTKTVDLAGRMAIPGIIEPHIHVVSLGNRPGYHTILENTASIIEVQQTLAERAREVPAGQWITSMGGWHPNQWAEHRLPTLAELDAACPNHPVLLYLQFTGPCATNSRGKALFDAWDANPPVPHPQLVPVAASSTGVIAGGLFGLSPSTAALYHLRSLQTFEDKLRSTHEAMQYSASLGETTHSDKVLFPTPGPLSPTQILSNLDQYRMYDAWLELDRRGMALTRLEINFLHNQGFISSLGDLSAQLPELRERLRNQFQQHGSDRLYVGGIGEWAAPLNVNRTTPAGQVWFESQRLVAEAGWRNENAVESLANLQGVIEAWEELDKTYGIKDKRYIIHHHPATQFDAALLTRLQNLGAGVAMAAFRWVGSSNPAVIAGVPFRSIVNHGIKAGLQGDGVHIAPLNPWLHIYYVVTGRNSFGQQVNAGQQLSREEALRLFTRENAWFITRDTTVGTIEPGKNADIAVLDQDYFQVSDEEIKEMRSAMTIVGGEIVHVDDHDERKWRCRGMFKRGRRDRR